MEALKRKIRLFLATYGKPLLQGIGVILLIIFVIQGLNYYTIVTNQKNESKKLEYQKKKEEEQKEEKIIEEDKNIILEFLDDCSKKNIQKAFNMLTEDCKQDKYATTKELEEKYVNKIFNKKYDFEVNYQGNIYQVVFLEDILQSGSVNDRNKLEEYYLIEEDVLGNKTIYINYERNK